MTSCNNNEHDILARTANGKNAHPVKAVTAFVGYTCSIRGAAASTPVVVVYYNVILSWHCARLTWWDDCVIVFCPVRGRERSPTTRNHHTRNAGRLTSDENDFSTTFQAQTLGRTFFVSARARSRPTARGSIGAVGGRIKTPTVVFDFQTHTPNRQTSPNRNLKPPTTDGLSYVPSSNTPRETDREPAECRLQCRN